MDMAGTSGLGWNLYMAWLLGLSLVTFVLFRSDKRRAQRPGASRVPESQLLLLLLLGGFIGGGAAMYMRPRHKTRKPQFVLALLASTLIHAYLLWWGFAA